MPKAKPKAEEEPVKQWIAIAPESFNLGRPSESEQAAVFLPLLHPKTGESALFLFSPDGKTICELIKFQNEPRSWFVGETVQKDGSLYLMTPIDPLFLALPFLAKAADESSRFSLLDQILESSEHPAATKLTDALKTDQVELLCDGKGSGEYTGYRLNADKLEKWLKAKVEQLASQLRTSGVNVSSGAKAATYVRSTTQCPDASNEEYSHYASGMVSSYLSEEHESLLSKLFPAPKSAVKASSGDAKDAGSAESLEPAAKRRKLSDGTADNGDHQVEDYRDAGATPGAGSAKKKSQTVAQKRLSKVDKSGMKSMTSFFGKKPSKS